MRGNSIIPQNGNGKQPSLEARAFVVAFIPTKTQPNITQKWSLKASEAINTLIDFRSAIRPHVRGFNAHRRGGEK